MSAQPGYYQPPNLTTLQQLKITLDEYGMIEKLLQRAPNDVELAMFSAMWSEHCSYKSSKEWLRMLPTKAPWVLCGPGEGAGVVDIGDGDAIAFKIESHNKPSMIEPKNGAATGVGGIIRDVFTMGARPIALLNALRFGDPNNGRMQRIIDGVVHGIASYGNAIGVPTVGGETHFDPAYNDNVLVNAMCVGYLQAHKLKTSRGGSAGDIIMYAGQKTGRDGVHAASMSSAALSHDNTAKKPTIQIGDPFVGKKLLEATLTLLETDVVLAIQDMGAAGLTCSSVEMGAKNKLGINLNLDLVPTREPNLSALELMLSESQERILFVVKPDNVAVAEKIFARWDVDCVAIGHLTDNGIATITHQNNVVAYIPIKHLVDDAPIYIRPVEFPVTPRAITVQSNGTDWLTALKVMLGSVELTSKTWVYQQYDQQVMGDSVALPGSADAAIVRIHGTSKGIALTCDCTHRYVQADPFNGGMQAVAEAWRNLCAVGAQPLALTNNLNFASPERPAVMGQFIKALEGMREACQALDFPVVSGNVSFYNETADKLIPPTPVIGGLGLLPAIDRHAKLSFTASEMAIILLGTPTTSLSQSVYQRVLLGGLAGAVPTVDLTAEKTAGILVRALISHGLTNTVHDISDGGLLPALAEMTFAHNIGVDLRLNDTSAERLFGESQATYIIATTNPQAVLGQAQQHQVPAQIIGKTIPQQFLLNGHGCAIEELRAIYHHTLPTLLP